MARFEIHTPVRGFKGEGAAGVMFDNGVAVISSDTAQGLSALMYFRQGGYGVFPLDGVSVDEVLQRNNESPEQESARLDREIESLKARQGIEDKRAERDRLYAAVYGEDTGVPAGEPTALTTGILPTVAQAVDGDPGVVPAPDERGDDEPARQGEGASSDLLAPPANNASADEWRAWAVQSGRATEDEVASRSRTELISTLGADYDRDREEQLKGGVA